MQTFGDLDCRHFVDRLLAMADKTFGWKTFALGWYSILQTDIWTQIHLANTIFGQYDIWQKWHLPIMTIDQNDISPIWYLADLTIFTMFDRHRNARVILSCHFVASFCHVILSCHFVASFVTSFCRVILSCHFVTSFCCSILSPHFVDMHVLTRRWPNVCRANGFRQKVGEPLAFNNKK